MIIESKAPTRVDFAGSTLDIWPLYLVSSRISHLERGYLALRFLRNSNARALG